MNPLHPKHLTPAERRSELCNILARGLMRFRLQQSSEVSIDTGESSLHNSASQSGHAATREWRNA